MPAKKKDISTVPDLQVNSNIGGIIMNICVWDKTLADYRRHVNEHSDDRRIMRAVADCAGGVLYFPRGIYTVIPKYNTGWI